MIIHWKSTQFHDDDWVFHWMSLKILNFPLNSHRKPMKIHDHRWISTRNHWKSITCCRHFNENQRKSLIIHWKSMNIHADGWFSHRFSLEIFTFTLDLHRKSMIIHDSHWKSITFHWISIEIQWKSMAAPLAAPRGPRGPPGAVEVFYLSRARRLYCLVLSRLLICWPGGDPPLKIYKFDWNLV